MKKNTTVLAPTETLRKVSPKKSSVKKVMSPPIKKVLKKTAARSAIPTITIPKKNQGNAARSFVIAPDPQSFWTNDGQILNNLTALAESFATMDTLLYKYHVQNEQNDFADWVERVLEDEVCAVALRKAKTPKSAHMIVIKHLRNYA